MDLTMSNPLNQLKKAIKNKSDFELDTAVANLETFFKKLKDAITSPKTCCEF
jgi:hypothetical protein